MEAIISKQCLSAALARIAGIADRKSSMQILSNVLISAEGHKHLKIAATDLALSAFGLFPADVVKGGAVTLPAKTLHDIVRSLPPGPVTLLSEGENTEIRSGRSKFKLLGLPAEDYPRLPDAKDVEFFELDASLPARMIDFTSFSISHDETRPHINGALFEGDGKILRMVTTDGHRLSKAEFKIDESVFFNFSMVLPSKAVSEVKHLLEDGVGTVSIGSKGGSVFLRRVIEIEKGDDAGSAQTAEFVLVSKLIEADFPPYDQVIPKQHERLVIMPRQVFLDAMRRVSVLSSERTLGVKIQLSEGVIAISTDNPAVGEGQENIDVSYDGDAIEIGFNARYFIDALAVLGGDEVHLELSGALDPAVIRDPGGLFVGVIMPMRI
jgi:DNA polymerase-3 subunit beta